MRQQPKAQTNASFPGFPLDTPGFLIIIARLWRYTMASGNSICGQVIGAAK